MEGQNNNIYAFPISTIDGYIQEGMSLRDYFAGKAMQALINRQYLNNSRTNELHNMPNDAYAIADAMLKARNQ